MVCLTIEYYSLCLDIDLSFLSQPLTELANQSPSGFLIILILVIASAIIAIVNVASIKYYRELAQYAIKETREAYANAFLLATNQTEKINNLKLENNENPNKKWWKMRKKK